MSYCCKPFAETGEHDPKCGMNPIPFDFDPTEVTPSKYVPEKTGVGCPMCKHEGPYWVEACGLHKIIHDQTDRLMTLNQSYRECTKFEDALARLFDLDLEMPLLPQMQNIADEMEGK